MKKASIIISFTVLLVIVACDNKKGLLSPIVAPLPVNACDSIRYDNAAKFILDKNCIMCHGGAFASGGVNLTTYASAKLKALDGRIKDRITNTNNPMPPSGLMPQDKIDSLMCWIDKGARQ